ncbi:UNVERIFIED_CONTAM: hypothetical protein Sradi_2072200 [Sesamum radiatum]|uniref:Uncharacterized protein n=1 Tax=Sesamum radiatum TaxID=300843 RepID=A0AAW2TIP9_SESRA
MIFDTAGPAFWASNYKQDGAPDDDMRSCSTDAEPSSYTVGPPYDYVSGLADPFHDVVHAAKQPLWKGCIQSKWDAFAELVNIKTESHISKHIYDRIFQWADHILPRNHTLPMDYYSTKKLIKNLGLPVVKINACKNGCMLY